MITRRVPIDFPALSMATGITNGTVGLMGGLGWVVRDNNCRDGIHVASITPPAMLPGETAVSIINNEWCFHRKD